MTPCQMRWLGCFSCLSHAWGTLMVDYLLKQSSAIKLSEGEQMRKFLWGGSTVARREEGALVENIANPARPKYHCAYVVGKKKLVKR